MITPRENAVGLFGIDLGEFCIRENRRGVWTESAAVLYAISGGQEVTALNTRTWWGLEEGQVSTHKHTHSDGAFGCSA